MTVNHGGAPVFRSRPCRRGEARQDVRGPRIGHRASRSAPARRAPVGLGGRPARPTVSRPRLTGHKRGEPMEGQTRTGLRRPSADLPAGGELAPGPDRGRASLGADGASQSTGPSGLARASAPKACPSAAKGPQASTTLVVQYRVGRPGREARYGRRKPGELPARRGDFAPKARTPAAAAQPPWRRSREVGELGEARAF